MVMYVQGYLAPAAVALEAVSRGNEAVVEEEQLADSPAKSASKGRKTWLSVFKVLPKRSSTVSSPASNQPQTIAEVTDIVAANTPVFFFHNQEQ